MAGIRQNFSPEVRIKPFELSVNMCAICGYVGRATEDDLSNMLDQIAHRGPDAQGKWKSGNVGLGHARLSILDLKTGDQPMAFGDNRLHIVFNGQIYNYQVLRKTLSDLGHSFRTRSDTEVILAAYLEWGSQCVTRLFGMFAFAIWDAKKKELFLVRDRLGIKPLCYAVVGDSIAFASETKALLQWSQINPSVDPVSVHQTVAYRYVRGTRTMWKEISRFPPAHWGVFRDGKLQLNRYWSPSEEGGMDSKHAQNELAELMHNVVGDHLVADVKISSFISGGLDSTALTAWMRENGYDSLHTFCMAFGTQNDETEYASSAAKKLGCKHSTIYLKPDEFENLNRIVWHLDEPVSDSITIATYALGREAAKKYKVVLSGEGADEVFGGYIHFRVLRALDQISFLPVATLLPLLQSFFKLTPLKLLQALFPYPGNLGASGRERILGLIGTLGNPATCYQKLTSVFDEEERKELYEPSFKALVDEYEVEHSQYIQEMMAKHKSKVAAAIKMDLEDWLPNYTLHRLDRLLMAHGLEGRVPYADHRIIEFALKYSPKVHLSLSEEKKLLRAAAPKNIKPWAQRRKQAFILPLDSPLYNSVAKEVIQGLLKDAANANRGYFKQDILKRMAQTGIEDILRSKQAMAVALLECWHQVFIDKSSATEKIAKFL